jgi:quercetin dioxygenase-like cupin family protein
MDYGARHADDGTEGRLVSLFRFTEDWAGWEMHPAGSEVVVCLEGELELIQETADGSHQRTRLKPGDYAINPPGVWHTADLPTGQAAGLFVTPGVGTQGRPR